MRRDARTESDGSKHPYELARIKAGAAEGAMPAKASEIDRAMRSSSQAR
jgi:hypothetical protein